MPLPLAFLAVLAVPFALAAGAPIQHAAHEHSHGEEKLGTVDFPVSCTPAAQEKFTRATALLHSFAYEESEKAFSDVKAADPKCAMADWGVAMSLFHPIWASANPAAAPTPAELQRGKEASGRAAAAGAPTARERDYIGAVGAFYSDAPDYMARARAFEQAMAGVHERHPGDREATIFYALAILGTAPVHDKTYAQQKKAAELLNRVLPDAPDHPGVAHYLIHSFDYPQLAELALPAARTYSKIAPSAPHALHMPSHIFVRLALWDESIDSNLASAETAREWVARSHPGATSFDELHALDYLAYAYLQQGRDREASEVARAVAAVKTLDAPNFAAAYALAAVPARMALERGDWKKGIEVDRGPAGFPWDRFLGSQALTEFARAVSGARGGDPARARDALVRLQALRATLTDRKDEYWAEQVEIQRLAGAAWLAQAEGKAEEARTLLRSAADREDRSEKHPVTPGAVLPAREMLGDLLLEQGRTEEALAAYETSLQSAPGRFRSLAGAARAAGRAGSPAKARDYYAKLLALSEKSDGSRPETAEARAFLAKAD
jgi:tetratricopeptide (TPR) repeat protein